MTLVEIELLKFYFQAIRVRMMLNTRHKKTECRKIFNIQLLLLITNYYLFLIGVTIRTGLHYATIVI